MGKGEGEGKGEGDTEGKGRRVTLSDSECGSLRCRERLPRSSERMTLSLNERRTSSMFST